MEKSKHQCDYEAKYQELLEILYVGKPAYHNDPTHGGAIVLDAIEHYHRHKAQIENDIARAERSPECCAIKLQILRAELQRYTRTDDAINERSHRLEDERARYEGILVALSRHPYRLQFYRGVDLAVTADDQPPTVHIQMATEKHRLRNL